eukprot:scaffold172363_cov19-Tisochrysis_lutea.AAC.1
MERTRSTRSPGAPCSVKKACWSGTAFQMCDTSCMHASQLKSHACTGNGCPERRREEERKTLYATSLMRQEALMKGGTLTKGDFR